MAAIGNPPHRLNSPVSKATRIRYIVLDGRKTLINLDVTKTILRFMMTLIIMINGILHTPISYCDLFSYV